MDVSIRLAWHPEITAETCGDGAFVVQGQTSRLTLTGLDPTTIVMLTRLAPPGQDETALDDAFLESGGMVALSHWYRTRQRLLDRALVTRSVLANGVRLATLTSLAAGGRVGSAFLAPGKPVRLCRFAYVRREEGTLVLESPRSHSRVVLDAPSAIEMVGSLASAGTIAEHSARVAGLTLKACATLLSLLGDAEMLENETVSGESTPLQSWEFHDLLFHGRSRKGRSDAPFGAAYRPVAGPCPPPVFHPKASDETLALDRPDLTRLAREDPPLTLVLETRRSLRDYAEFPLTIGQLGEFLFRVARAKDCRLVDVETPNGAVTVEFAARPFPSGGALYELEFYLAVQSCDGLDPGLYHYDPKEHSLARLRRTTVDSDLIRLIRDAAASASIKAERVQILIILSARFRRLSWKYASITYALILKHVGVVYQTMYLIATAMGLAPCALGAGDSDLFARTAGLDYYEESSVGEFLLGSALDPVNEVAVRNVKA